LWNSSVSNIASLGETGNCFGRAMYKLALLPPMPMQQSGKDFSQLQGYSKVPPGFPNSTAQQPRQTRQKGAYQ